MFNKYNFSNEGNKLTLTLKNKEIITININNFEYSKSKPFIDEDAFYEKLVITLGPKGCKYKDKIYPVEKTEVIDQVGAGDTFIAALAVKFLENNQIHESIEFANLCATKAVKKKGVVAVKK